MRARPNPWLVVPSLVAGVAAGVIGWLVTDVSCAGVVPGVVEHCYGWATVVGAVAFAGVTAAMLVVMVLVSRSIAEARAAHDLGQEPPGPGCEVPPIDTGGSEADGS